MESNRTRTLVPRTDDFHTDGRGRARGIEMLEDVARNGRTSFLVQGVVGAGPFVQCLGAATPSRVLDPGGAARDRSSSRRQFARASARKSLKAGEASRHQSSEKVGSADGLNGKSVRRRAPIGVRGCH